MRFYSKSEYFFFSGHYKSLEQTCDMINYKAYDPGSTQLIEQDKTSGFPALQLTMNRCNGCCARYI